MCRRQFEIHNKKNLQAFVLSSDTAEAGIPDFFAFSSLSAAEEYAFPALLAADSALLTADSALL